MLTTDLQHLATESDVEQKLLYPLLREILGFDDGEIFTKAYLSPTDLDKGAGKRAGYYPDYAIYLLGQPVLIVEAKSPEESVEGGYREARLYATEVNKLFPPGVNPISHVLSCNGRSLMFSAWDSEGDSATFEVASLQPGMAGLEGIRKKLIRDVLVAHARAVRKALATTARFRPLSLIGGPARQNELVQDNTFSGDLVPILRKYFDPDETQYSAEILQKGYVSSDEITKYNADLETLLKERIPNGENIRTISTTKSHAEQLDLALKRAVADRRDIPDPLILLVGSVGAGKSMFIQRYRQHLIDEKLRGSTRWIVINFNKAKDNLADIEKWVCEQVIAELESNEGEEFLAYENLLKYFSPDIARLTAGPLKPLKTHDPVAYDLEIGRRLDEWCKDSAHLCRGIIRYFTKDCGIPVVAVFDNVDRRSRDQQLAIFQTVQWFRGENKCFSVLTLRDETYDAYKSEPPLDAFLNPFTFRITAPRFINVVKKRLELAIDFLNTKTAKRLTYSLPNGTSIEYPASNLGHYLIAIYLALFNQRRATRFVLEALSGRDIRRALEMFIDILTSGYLSDRDIFNMTAGYKAELPEWLVLRVLMRTKYRYYTPSHGYIFNIFAIREESEAANLFLVPELLLHLSDRRKERKEFRLEGYLLVGGIVSRFIKSGYSKDDILWALEEMLRAGMIGADHQKTSGVDFQDYVKITASGHLHISFLPTRVEYLSNVTFDIRFPDQQIAKRVAENHEDTRPHPLRRLRYLEQGLQKELRDADHLRPSFSSAIRAASFVSECLADAMTHM